MVNALALNADEGQFVQLVALFQNFMGQPDQSPVDLRSAHELSFFFCGSHKLEILA